MPFTRENVESEFLSLIEYVFRLRYLLLYEHPHHVGAKYALLRFSFVKKNIRPLPCSSSSEKSHVRVS